VNITDIHCHILYGVDDGSGSLDESISMLHAAYACGIETVICTPHVYSAEDDLRKIRNVFKTVRAEADRIGIQLRQGYECNYRLMLETEAADMRAYRFEDTDILLLEPPSGYLPDLWENRIYDLQNEGIEVIIAHPERCRDFQESISLARRMAEIGCRLQVSACDLFGGFFSAYKKTALKMINEGLISFIASDAHCVGDFRYYLKAMKRYPHIMKQTAENCVDR